MFITNQANDKNPRHIINLSDRNRSGDYWHVEIEGSGQRKRYIRSRDEKEVNLPNIPKNQRIKWINTKARVSRLLGLAFKKISTG